jgi:hypothetical protein
MHDLGRAYKPQALASNKASRTGDPVEFKIRVQLEVVAEISIL